MNQEPLADTVKQQHLNNETQFKMLKFEMNTLKGEVNDIKIML